MGEAARTHVQLPQAAGQWPAGGQYREGFRQWVASHAGPRDRVLILESNPARIIALESLWAGDSRVEVRQLHVAGVDDPAQQVALYFAIDDRGPDPVHCVDPRVVRTYVPNARLASEVIDQTRLATLITEVTAESPIGMLSIDLRESGLALVDDLDWSRQQIAEVSLTTQGPRAQDLRSVDRRLRGCGWLRAGRAWGEANTGARYRRCSSWWERVTSWLAQAKVDLGAGVVQARAGLPDAHQRARLGERLLAGLTGNRLRPGVLDDDFGRPLEILERHQIRELAARASVADEGVVDVPLAEPDPRQVAEECRQRHGVWPISFSYPGELLEPRAVRERLIADIIPGYAYSFEDHDEYMAAYADSWFGVTHHKAGWDCFRHVEILAAGAIPWMVDADRIPGFSMVHYPKHAMTKIAHVMSHSPGTPASSTVQQFRSHLERHLTSRAMARYLLESAGLMDARRILFVDEQHPAASDYQSTLTLIGLKQLRGQDVEPMFPAPWVYQDFQGSTSHLYGRGFGYVRSVSPQARTSREESWASGRIDPIDPADFDAVVVGSISRNRDLAMRLLEVAPARATVWVHGEDLPPTKKEADWLRGSGTAVFVRSIHRTP